MTPTAAQALVETLYHHGVDRVFCVPGESYLAVLDALYDRPEIQTVCCRHEGGAGFMAVADAKITGCPGIALVSRAPGAGNAAVAVYTAREDAVPLLLFVGQVPLSDRGMGAFQELDYDKLFGDIAKSVIEVTDPGQLAPAAAEAFRVARTGTPGPVVVAMPEDMLTLPAQAEAVGPLPVARPAPSDAEVSRVAERLARAERPLLIAGGEASGPAARRALEAVSDAWRVPVAVSFKHQDLFANEHPHFAGHLGYAMPASVVDTLGKADRLGHGDSAKEAGRVDSVKTASISARREGLPVGLWPTRRLAQRQGRPACAAVAGLRRNRARALRAAAPVANA